jgi:hypothetical protein
MRVYFLSEKKGISMISATCDFKEFVESIKDKGYMEVIRLANQEATEAWRCSHHMTEEIDSAQQQNLTSYETILKGFIDFLRYGVKPAGLNDKDLELFLSACRSLRNRYTRQMRCEELL